MFLWDGITPAVPPILTLARPAFYIKLLPKKTVTRNDVIPNGACSRGAVSLAGYNLGTGVLQYIIKNYITGYYICQYIFKKCLRNRLFEIIIYINIKVKMHYI